MIPVIFTHYGPLPEYIFETINCARNAGNTCILLGDELIERYDRGDKMEMLSNVYRHMTTGERSYELFCLQRWMIILNYCKDNDIPHFFYCDSDVKLFCDVSHYEDRFSGILHCMVPESASSNRPVASGHCSYWTTELLEMFCLHILHYYSQPGKLARLEQHWAARKGRGGGVCDMTLLYYFLEELPTYRSLLKVFYDGTTFDDNINTSDNYLEAEYAVDNEKGIKWVEEHAKVQPFHLPTIYNLKKERFVKFNSLHYCEDAKRFI